jgi:YD repeat-containing protein
MSCYITSGVQNDSCGVGVGSIKEIYIVGGGEITGFTYDANDQITGMTSTTGTTTLYKFELKRGTSSLTQTINKSYENGTLFFEQVLNIVLYKMDYVKRNQILLLAVNDFLQIVAVDNNGIQYFLGKVNGMTLSGTTETGTALADRNGMSLTFTAQEPELADLISGNLSDVFDGVIS